MIILDQHLSQNRAKLLVLILEAEGIHSRLNQTDDGWTIEVPRAKMDAAWESIWAYDAENPDGLEPSQSIRPFLPKTVTGLYAAGVLAAVHAAVSTSADQQIYLNSFGASASEIVNGQYYRCVTALLLHIDSAHLVANMAALAIFGTAVCRVTGWGLGWLMLVMAGAAGNLANAYFYGSGHLSIGASTAVFSAVGLLAGYGCRQGYSRFYGRRKAWIPLGAGLAIIAFMGTGTQTDIMAHLFGFLAGLPLGLAHPLYAQYGNRRVYQAGSMLLALTLIIGAWLRGW